MSQDGISKPKQVGTGVTYTVKGSPDTGPPMRPLNPPKKDTGKIGG